VRNCPQYNTWQEDQTKNPSKDWEERQEVSILRTGGGKKHFLKRQSDGFRPQLQGIVRENPSANAATRGGARVQKRPEGGLDPLSGIP